MWIEETGLPRGWMGYKIIKVLKIWIRKLIRNIFKSIQEPLYQFCGGYCTAWEIVGHSRRTLLLTLRLRKQARCKYTRISATWHILTIEWSIRWSIVQDQRVWLSRMRIGKVLRSSIKMKIILHSLTEILRAPRIQMNVTHPHRYRISITHSYKDKIYYVR